MHVDVDVHWPRGPSKHRRKAAPSGTGGGGGGGREGGKEEQGLEELIWSPHSDISGPIELEHSVFYSRWWTRL